MAETDSWNRPQASKSDDDNSSDDVVLNIGWRRGQPPRSDVVVKLSSETSAARATNKILVSQAEERNDSSEKLVGDMYVRY
jgi:hypothetical protein